MVVALADVVSAVAAKVVVTPVALGVVVVVRHGLKFLMGRSRVKLKKKVKNCLWQNIWRFLHES